MAGGILLLFIALSNWKGREASGETAPEARNADVPVRILPLGDSITQANKYHLSYRYNLWKELLDAGINFDFVGSLNHNYLGSPTWPDYKGKPFDRDHEGHCGWTIDQILGGVPGEEENGKLSEWLEEYTPDIALIHLGSNDIFEGQSTSSTVSELKEVIDTLRADNPRVAILLAKLIPTDNDDTNARTNELNAQIDGIAKETSTAASPVIVVDQNGGFDIEADTFDGVHPNESGEAKIAAQWFDALQALLAERTSKTDNHPNQ